MARPSERLSLIIIFMTVLLNMIGFGVIMPVMPKLIMQVTGEDLAHAAKWGGILSASYAIMQFLMMPVLGALSDQYGRRPVLLGSLAAYSVDFLLMALAPSIGFLLAARTLAGGFSATFSTANAYIADISPPERRASRFGMMGAAFGLGFIIGPAVGGFVGEHFGPRAPFFLVAALGCVNFAFGLAFLPETLRPENRRSFDWRRANALGNFRQFRQYPAIAPIAMTIFLAQLAQWTFPSVWSYFAEERFSWTPSEIGLSLVAVGLAAAIVQGGLTRLVVPRIGERRAAMFSLSVATAVYLGYAFATEGWMIYALIPVGALAGFTLPSLQGVMSRTMPANAQGELQGAIGALNGLSMILGPWLMTQIFSAFVKPGAPIEIGGVTVLPHGAPFYLPGAPFIAASALVFAALLLLRSTAGKEASASPAQAGSKEEPVHSAPS